MSIPASTDPKKVYTYADYSSLPEGSHYQLIGGDLVMTPAPSTYHQRISKRIEFIFVGFLEKKSDMAEVLYAPIDVYFSDKEVYQPDIIVISRERIDIIGEDKIEGAPDLIVEILSPSTAYYDLRHKKDVYARGGVREYWIVDPLEKSIEIHTNTDSGFNCTTKAIVSGEVTSGLYSGLVVQLGEIF